MLLSLLHLYQKLLRLHSVRFIYNDCLRVCSQVLEIGQECIQDVRACIDSNIRLNVATSLVRPAVPKQRYALDSRPFIALRSLVVDFRFALVCCSCEIPKKQSCTRERSATRHDLPVAATM